MNLWFLTVSALLSLARPNAARVRLGRLGARFRWGEEPSAPQGPFRRRPVAIAADLALANPRRATAVVGAAVWVLMILVGMRLPIGLAAGLVAAVAVDAALATAHGRRSRRDDAALAMALGVLEAELVAGAREETALRAAAAVAGRSGALLREAAMVTGYGDETARVLSRSDLLLPLSSAWRVRHACGAPLADVVTQVARDVELRRKRDIAVDTALAGPRSSSALLAGLPVIGVALGTAMGARPGPFLFSSAAGSAVLLTGVGLDVAGWLWTTAMVRRARR